MPSLEGLLCLPAISVSRAWRRYQETSHYIRRAGQSHRRATTQVRYRDEILRPIVRPYSGFLLAQDNAWPHVAKVGRQFLDDKGIDAID